MNFIMRVFIGVIQQHVFHIAGILFISGSQIHIHAISKKLLVPALGNRYPCPVDTVGTPRFLAEGTILLVRTIPVELKEHIMYRTEIVVQMPGFFFRDSQRIFQPFVDMRF